MMTAEPQPMAPNTARYVVNLRGWPGLADWQPPSLPPAYAPRLGEHVGLVVVSAASARAVRERFGLGAYLEIVGRSVLGGGIIVPDDLAEIDPSALDAMAVWARSHPIETTAGPRPWSVVTLAQFYEPHHGVFASRTYVGAGWCIGAELGRVFGLAAEHCAPRRGRGVGTWELWLPGWGVKGPKGWHRASPHRPALRVSPRRTGWQVEYGPVGNDREGKAAGKRVNGRVWRGAFIDVLSLAYALDADRGASFAEHCANFEMRAIELPVTVSVDEYGVARMAEAAVAVHRLAVVLDEETGRWFTTPQERAEERGRLDLARTSSPGAVAAAVPARFRVRAPIETFGLRDSEHQAWAETFHGGWCEADHRLLGVPFPVVAADVSSCHPLVAHRLGWWDVVCAERIERHVVTAALRRFCERVVADPTATLDPDHWARFGCTLVEVEARGEPFPIEVQDEQRPDGRMEVVPVTSPGRLLRFAWPDVVSAAVSSGRVPRIIRAVHFAPVGRQGHLRRRLPVLPGLVLDADEDPVLGLVAHRRASKAREDMTMAADLRVVVNSLVFGNPCRSDEILRRDGRRWVTGERPGPWSCFPIAASVTAGSRLLLAVLDRLVTERGGLVAYRDTDSGLIPASPEGGTLDLPGSSTVRLLTWSEVNQVLDAFAPLAPAPWWPVWDTERGTPEVPRRALVFGSKRHVEVGETQAREKATDDGSGEVVDGTEAQLGSTYADPPTMRGRSPEGLRNWSLAAVTREFAYAEVRQADPDRALRPGAPWDSAGQPAFPAMRRFMVKTSEAARRLPVVLGARPGTLYVEGLVDVLRRGIDPTPVALDPGGDLADWQGLGWVAKDTGASVPTTTDLGEIGAVALETLDGRAVRWSKPPQAPRIDEVTVDPLLVRRVGRVSGVIDADLDGLDKLITRRPVHSEAAEAEAVSASAQAFGKRAFERTTRLPPTVAERAARGLPISVSNVVRALRALRETEIPTCGAEGCSEPVRRSGASYCSPRCRERERKRRQRARGPGTKGGESR